MLMKQSRSAILQTLVWVGIWSIFAFADTVQEKPSVFYLTTAMRILVLVGLFNVSSYLLRNFYFDGRRRAFGWWLVLTFVLYLGIDIAQEIYLLWPMQRAALAPGVGSGPRRIHWGFLIIPKLFSGMAVFGVASLTQAFAAFETKRKEQEVANRRRLEAELALLKSQINPHFLLNTLNNLYTLSLVDADRTPEALLKLSGMVRYILYDCQKPSVALQADLDFIQNYLDLQQLRLPPNASLIVDIPENVPEEVEVEPMILITFIENAFKHGLTTIRECQIGISVSLEGESLTLLVTNTLADKSEADKLEASGIGINNARKRLEHVYPERHILKIGESDNQYRVELTISL